MDSIATYHASEKGTYNHKAVGTSLLVVFRQLEKDAPGLIDLPQDQLLGITSASPAQDAPWDRFP